MTKDFKVFLQQFSEKIESVRGQKSFSDTELSRLDETIQGMLDLAEKAYSEDVQGLLNRFSVESTLGEMRHALEGHLCNIGNIQIDHGNDLIKITYNGMAHELQLIDIPTAMKIFFQVNASVQECYFVSAYLARNENYDIIQIYNFLRSRLQ